MPQINGPIYDSIGKPANGFLRIRANRPFDSGEDGGLNTRAQSTVTVRNGIPLWGGSPLILPVTPDGVWFRIEQDFDGDELQVVVVRVPEVQSMTFRELLFHRGDGSGGTAPFFWELPDGDDFPPEAPSGDWGVDLTSKPGSILIYKNDKD